MKQWQTEISEILEILFRIFSCPSYQFLPKAKIENSDLKYSEISEVFKFSTYPMVIVFF